MDDVGQPPEPSAGDPAVSRRLETGWLSWRSRITLTIVLTFALEFAALFGPGS